MQNPKVWGAAAPQDHTNHPHQPHQSHSCTHQIQQPSHHTNPTNPNTPTTETQKGNPPTTQKYIPLMSKHAKTMGGPLSENSSKCFTNGSTTLNTTTQHTHATQKNQHQTPQNTQLDTQRQTHTHPLTAKHLAKYSKIGNDARTSPQGFSLFSGIYLNFKKDK